MHRDVYGVIRYIVAVVAVFTMAFAAGCSDDSTSPPPAGDGTGLFIDAPVEGLNYVAGSHSGLTDANGRFTFTTGGTVALSITDIQLGSASALGVTTPIDLVPGAIDEKDSTVTNIARFLQTIDDDGDPSGTIVINDSIRTLAAGQTVNFNQSTADFGNDPNVVNLIQMFTAATTAGERGLITPLVAQQNLVVAVREILQGTYAVTLYLNDLNTTEAGQASFTVSLSGALGGSGTWNNNGPSPSTVFNLNGQMQVDGTVTGTGTAQSGTGAFTFGGTLDRQGKVNLQWLGSGGWSGSAGTMVGSKTGN